MVHAVSAELAAVAETWDAEQVVRWALAEYHPAVALASSFGAEDVVLIDLAVRRGHRNLQVFTLDTDFLFPETYRLIDEIESRYGIQVERLRPQLSPSDQASAYGEALWQSTPDLCCSLRKVKPLEARLSSLRAWITGIRREQAPTRANAKKIEWDQRFGLVKVNPLADWDAKQLWAYIARHCVPYNPLHDRNYPSIGCTHCTRPVQPGEDPRAGRWSGFSKTECGLHIKNEIKNEVNSEATTGA